MAGNGNAAPVTAASLGISAEEKLAMPLDALISAAKKEKKATQSTKKPKPLKQKKGTAGTPAVDTRRKQQNVKKTVTVPISKKERARASHVASSLKRQSVVNKRRPGLVVVPTAGKKKGIKVQLRSRVTSALRAAQTVKKQQVGKQGGRTMSGGLDVSNIVEHFRTHPTKFDLPKGTNLRITINLNNVKPVVGGKK